MGAGLLVAAIAALGYALLETAFFAQRNLLLPWRPAHVTLPALFFVLHAAVAMVTVVVVHRVVRRVRPALEETLPIFAGPAVLIAVHALTHYRERSGVLPRDLTGTVVTLGIVALIGAVALAAAWALRERTPVARRAGVLTGAALVLWGLASIITVRPQGDIVSVTPRPASEPLELAATGERVFVFGFDGATWDVLDPMIADGRLPNIGALAARGRTFDLETISPTFSPVIWTTVATGTQRFRHGIHDVVQTVLPGGVRLPRSIERTAFFTKTTGVLFRALHRSNRLPLVPYRSSDVRAPSVFEAASEAGLSTSLVEWYVTWPAVELSGVTVSDRFHLQTDAAPLSAVVYPEALEPEIAKHIVEEDAVPRDLVLGLADIDDLPAAERAAWEHDNASFLREMRLNFARDLTTRNVAVDLLQRDRTWDLFGVYFRSVDLSHHLTWKYHRTAAAGNPAGAPDDGGLGFVVERYHEFMDGVVGEILAQVPPEATIVLLSDHGFEDVYDHRRGPDGFAIVAGGAVEPSAERGRISVYDVAPTIARLLGVPHSEELPGRIREDVLDPEFVRTHPPFRVSTWEREDRSVATTGDALATDAEEIERLRALGYID